MTGSRFSLPPNCILRPAQKADRFALQRLVFTLIRSEAIGFDVRLLAYRLATIFVFLVLLRLQGWLLQNISSSIFQALLIVGMGLTVILMIASLTMLVLYILLIPTEPLFNWAMYWVIECDSYPIACAALTSDADCCVLYHVVVAKPWRRQSIASYLVHHLVQKSELPVYLVCKPKRASFYTHLGFVPISWQQLSKPLRAHFKDFERDRVISRVQWKIMCSSQVDPVAPPTTVK